jgi:hypothetical protein
MSAELSRRKWYQHWYRPGKDTPLGYFAAHVVFVALVLVGLQSAILGRGWHLMPEEILPGAFDLAWLVKVLNSKRARRRKLSLGRRFELRLSGMSGPDPGEALWIDTPESHAGIPLD